MSFSATCLISVLLKYESNHHSHDFPCNSTKEYSDLYSFNIPLISFILLPTRLPEETFTKIFMFCGNFMREKGFEPSKAYAHRILSPAPLTAWVPPQILPYYKVYVFIGLSHQDTETQRCYYTENL